MSDEKLRKILVSDWPELSGDWSSSVALIDEFEVTQEYSLC